jgi:septal ring factor EnvC (AmiA/AmiB activator)
MWPKLTQLLEFAPHLARLIPMADRFLQSKTASEEAARNAMEQMAEDLRGDLGKVAASHAGIYRQLNDQSEKLSTISADVHAARLSTDSLEVRIARLDKQLSRVWLSLAVALLLLVAVCILSGLILVHLHQVIRSS